MPPGWADYMAFPYAARVPEFRRWGVCVALALHERILFPVWLFSPAMRPPVDTTGFTLILATVLGVPGLHTAHVIMKEGASMGIRNLLGRAFEPPLSQRHFERAMAEQTELIRELGVKVVKGNVKVLAAVQEAHAEILALVSEMKQAVSDVSDDIRADDEARASDAAGSAPPDDGAG